MLLKSLFIIFLHSLWATDQCPKISSTDDELTALSETVEGKKLPGPSLGKKEMELDITDVIVGYKENRSVTVIERIDGSETFIVKGQNGESYLLPSEQDIAQFNSHKTIPSGSAGVHFEKWMADGKPSSTKIKEIGRDGISARLAPKELGKNVLFRSVDYEIGPTFFEQRKRFLAQWHEKGLALAKLPSDSPNLIAIENTRYLHGTTSAVLASMGEENSLIPSGQLLIKRRPILAGELGPGLMSDHGVNKRRISTIDLQPLHSKVNEADYSTIKYSKAVAIDKVAAYALPGPAVTYQQQLDWARKALVSLARVDATAFTIQFTLTDLRIRIINMMALNPEQLAKDWPVLNKRLEEMTQLLKTKGLKDGTIVDMTIPVASLKKDFQELKVAKIAKENHDLLDPPFSVIFGSRRKTEAPGAIYVRSDIKGEIGVKEMPLGNKEGWDVLYVPKDKIDRTKKWLQSRGLEGKVDVYDIDDLQAYYHMPQFK